MTLDFRDENSFYMLHAISSLPQNMPGPKLPLTFFHIGLMIYPDQIVAKDRFGRTALHYASASALMNRAESKTSCFHDQDNTQRPCGWDDPESTKYSISVPIIESFGTETKEQIIRNSSKIDILTKLYPEAASLFDRAMFLPLHLAIESEKKCREICECSSQSKVTIGWTRNIQKVLFANPDGLDKCDPNYHCYPFMQAAISQNSSLDSIYHILRMSPNLVDNGIQ